MGKIVVWWGTHFLCVPRIPKEEIILILFESLRFHRTTRVMILFVGSTETTINHPFSFPVKVGLLCRNGCQVFIRPGHTSCDTLIRVAGGGVSSAGRVRFLLEMDHHWRFDDLWR